MTRKVEVSAVGEHQGDEREAWFVVSPKSVSSSDEMAYYISEIMDIRDASEWTFDVPYMSSLPYLPTNLPKA